MRLHLAAALSLLLALISHASADMSYFKVRFNDVKLDRKGVCKDQEQAQVAWLSKLPFDGRVG
jgi:hypothetical protein